VTVHVSGCGCECECVEVEGGTTDALNPLSRPIHDQFLEPKCSCELICFCVYTHGCSYIDICTPAHTSVGGCVWVVVHVCVCVCVCVRVCVFILAHFDAAKGLF